MDNDQEESEVEIKRIRN
jgi:hypothetical protein